MNKILSIVTLFVLMVPDIWGQDTVTDIDGNVYETIQIGDQLWMKENLKTTHYNNGDEIPTGYSNSEWGNLSTGAYSVYPIDGGPYDNPSDIQALCGDNCADVFGNLYNWYAVDDERGLCPEDWHVSNVGYNVLTNYLGGESVAGGKMKECTEGSCPESEYWNSPNTGATNESGFTALPGGCRYGESSVYYSSMGGGDYIWSSEGDLSNVAWFRLLSASNSVIHRGSYLSKACGFSVRCLRDHIPETILVPQDYPTIQAGIDASADGDTVLVSLVLM